MSIVGEILISEYPSAVIVHRSGSMKVLSMQMVVRD
jgi:hypothetical protein